MPFMIVKRGQKFCVMTESSHGSGKPTGDPHGCHDTHEGAVSQLQAMYANVPEARKKELAARFKDAEKTILEGLLLPFGGPLNGKDLDGEYFSPNTDFALDWYDQRPLLYAHGRDESGPGTTPVGVIKSIEVDDRGGWMTAQLDKSSKYWAYIARLVDDGKLFLSSGALPHLVTKDYHTGELLRWPVVEGTLTPVPANPIASVGWKDASRHFAAVGLKEQWPGPALSLEDVRPIGREILTPAMDGTFEQLKEEVELACRSAFGPANMAGCYVVGTYVDRAIVRAFKDGEAEAEYYEIPYTYDDVAGVELGDPVEVEFTTAAKALTYLEESGSARDALLAWYHRTADASRLWAAKEGRKLTGGRRTRLEEWRDLLHQLASGVDDLLEETAPPSGQGPGDAEKRKSLNAALLGQYVTTAEITAGVVQE